MKKKTLVLGASPNPDRYAYKAIVSLLNHQHPVVAVGIKKGAVRGVEIEPAGAVHKDVNTITLYLGPHNQESYYQYIIETHPERIIFNPGTENGELIRLAVENGIQPVQACTLVLLASGQY
jgi:uncharacterized protein